MRWQIDLLKLSSASLNRGIYNQVHQNNITTTFRHRPTMTRASSYLTSTIPKAAASAGIGFAATLTKVSRTDSRVKKYTTVKYILGTTNNIFNNMSTACPQRSS